LQRRGMRGLLEGGTLAGRPSAGEAP